MEIENWVAIKGYEGLYEISDLGRVKSALSKEVLNPSVDVYGYLLLSLYKDRKGKTFKVHQLIAIAFHNHIPCGYEVVVDHIDNDKLNNRADNIQLISHRENIVKDLHKGGSKYTGVCWHKKAQKWISSIQIKGKRKYLGLFSDEYEAHLKYQAELKSLEC